MAPLRIHCCLFVRLLARLVTLNTMKASDELDEDQARELAHQLERAYSAFHSSLAN